MDTNRSPKVSLATRARIVAYGKLLLARQAEAGLDVLARARALRETIRARRRGSPLTAPEDVFAEMRQERDDDLAPVR